MKIEIWTVGAILAITLAACEDTRHYPISGQASSPDDPVHTMHRPYFFVMPIGGQD